MEGRKNPTDFELVLWDIVDQVFYGFLTASGVIAAIKLLW